MQIITSFLRMYWCYNRDAIFYPLPWRAYTSIPWTTILLKWHKYDRTMNLHKVYISSSEVCLTKVSNIFATSCSHGWRRQWHPTPVLLPGKSHGRRILVGCSPWGCKELGTIERFHFTHSTCFILYHWRGKCQPTPVFLSGESHGQRSLVGHGPWGHRESDMTEVTEHWAHMHIFIYKMILNTK